MNKMTTNFQKVVDFNKSFDVPVSTEIDKTVFTKNPKLVKLRLDLIKEEVKELEDAIKEHDMTETIDALADILYVVYGAGASFGIDLDKAMDLVHQSNMSKICRNKDVAERTVSWYKEQFESGKLPYDTPAMKEHPSGDERWIVYNESTGKVLKSVEYNPVKFDEMMK